MEALYAIPAWLGLLIVIGICIAVACGGHLLVHAAFRTDDWSEHNEVAGFIIAVVGVVYAVLLAFLTIVVWENFAQAEDRAQLEVDAVTDVWLLSRHLPAPEARRADADLLRYIGAIVHDEWPKMRNGESSEQAQRAIGALLDDVANVPVATAGRDATVQSHLLERIELSAGLRRRRLENNHSVIPDVLWLGLAIGALTVIGFVYLFGLRSFRVHLLMTAATAIVIGVAFGLIIELDYPFRGDLSVSPERWTALHDRILSDRR